MLCVAALGTSGACSKKADDQPPPGATPENEPGRALLDLELPVSLRMFDPTPSGAGQIEATDEQLRLDGQPVIQLERGKVSKSDRSGDIIPKLEARLRSPSRSALALRLQANLPYDTAALILSTAAKAGIHNASFAVREIGGSTKTGWLTVNGFVMSSKAEDLPNIPGVTAPTWNAFTDKWQAIFDGCRTSPNGNCAYVNDNFAQGGTLRTELMASGRGLNVNFFRRGLTQEQEAVEDKHRAEILSRKKEDFLQGRITHDDMVEALLLGDPSTYALFQFRYQEALKSPSALSKTMAPFCSKQRCGIVLTADPISPVLHIVTMLGAAFPDGNTAPALAFEMPWTERPKPAQLAEFIATQQKL